MKIITHFKHFGEPAEGLTPRIKIRNINENNIVVDSVAMEELGDGFYNFNFTEYQEGNGYTLIIDGGIELPSGDRYSTGIIQSLDMISAVQFLKDVEGGKWEIENNKMVFYKEDNTTEVAKFNLYNKQGQPTEVDVYKRTRYYSPTSGKLIISADNLNKDDLIILTDGIYKAYVDINNFVLNLNMPLYANFTLEQIMNNLRIVINNQTQQQNIIQIINNKIEFESGITGITSKIHINITDESNDLFKILMAHYSNFNIQKINGHGEEGPQ